MRLAFNLQGLNSPDDSNGKQTHVTRQQYFVASPHKSGGAIKPAVCRYSSVCPSRWNKQEQHGGLAGAADLAHTFLAEDTV